MAIALIAASVTIAITVFELIGGTDHAKSRPPLITAAIAGGWFVVSARLTWLVVGRGGSTMARPPIVLVIAALATPILIFSGCISSTGCIRIRPSRSATDVSVTRS